MFIEYLLHMKQSEWLILRFFIIFFLVLYCVNVQLYLMVIVAITAHELMIFLIDYFLNIAQQYKLLLQMEKENNK